jgi:hypothetical protein
MVEKEELELTCTEYWIAFPLVVVDGFQASPTAHDPEQELLVSCIGTGVLGGVAEGVCDSAKLPTEDQGETLLVVTESSACTRQYHVPLARVTDQLVPEIQPDV